MRICEGDKWKTAFRTQYDHFKYQVMSFGLSNAPSTFQSYVNKILAEKLDIFIIVYLDDILIYTEDPGQLHVEAMRWILDQLRKYSLFANLKKCCFYQDEVCFLGYVVSSKGISIEAKKIEVLQKWLEPKSVQDIQVFLGFANFYQQFIQGFGKIAAPLTSMLKTIISSQVLVANEMLAANEVGGVKGSDELIEKYGKLLKTRKLSKSGNLKGKKLAKSKKPSKSGNSPNFNATEAGPSFLTPKAKIAFNRLRLAFTKALILWHFDPKCHIWIETDVLGYAIGGMLSQLASWTSPDKIITKANLGQWHLVAFFSKKIILVETEYETHNGEFLAIVKAFKMWRHYLEGCKHEVLVFTDHNNLRCFIDTKNLSSRQICWAQKLS